MNARGSSDSSQLSSLLESLPGIASVLRSPVADAIVGMIRSAIGLRDFSDEEAKELIRYAVRRGLIGPDEGDSVLEEVEQAGGGRKRAKRSAGKKPAGGEAKRSGSTNKPAGRAPARAAKTAKRAAKTAKRAAKKTAKKTTGRTAKKTSARKTAAAKRRSPSKARTAKKTARAQPRKKKPAKKR